MDYRHTCDIIYTHFQGITNNIYGFGRPFLLFHFFIHPPTFLLVHIRLYPSKWRVDGSLHKAMILTLAGVHDTILNWQLNQKQGEIYMTILDFSCVILQSWYMFPTTF